MSRLLSLRVVCSLERQHTLGLHLIISRNIECWYRSSFYDYVKNDRYPNPISLSVRPLWMLILLCKLLDVFLRFSYYSIFSYHNAILLAFCPFSNQKKCSKDFLNGLALVPAITCHKLKRAKTSNTYGKTSSTLRSSSVQQFSSCPRRACRDEIMKIICLKTRL